MSLFLPFVSSWPLLPPACTSDLCPAPASLLGVLMFQSLFSVLDAAPVPVVWLTAGGIVTLGVWAFAGGRVAAWVGGLLGGAAVVAWAIYVVAAWYAADPRFVVGVVVGLIGGFFVGSGLLIFAEARRAPYGED